MVNSRVKSSQGLPQDYHPTENEPYMNETQLAFFRQKLTQWRDELLNGASHALSSLQEDSLRQPDITDRATIEIDQSLELRTRNREMKLVSKIDEALHKIEDGSYGYCDETGEPIGIKRLLARPIANLCIEAQEQYERQRRLRR